MSRFYLRLALIPITLFTVALILIHAQPYDDHELRQLLLPEGCPAPCFMGIRPGVTTVDEAVKILEASEWVATTDKQFMPSFIMWKASPKAAHWLDLQHNNGVSFQNGRVISVDVMTNFTISDVPLTFGHPDIEDVNLADWDHFYYRGVYFDQGFFVEGDHRCPAPEIDIWKTKFSVRFLNMPSANMGYDYKIPWGEAIFYCRIFNPLAGL